ncbi:MAG: penicillin-binding protein 1C [Bacteroidota bacterium]
MKRPRTSTIRAFFWKRRKIFAFLFGIFLIWYIFCLPRPLFDVPYSTVLEDKNGGLLGAHIASDGQWRFPETDSLPEAYIQSVLTFEDKRFFRHPGVDVRSIGRAIQQNLRNGSIVSGGSTITMQVVRMARGNRRRTVWQKLLEAIIATRLEWSYSKEEILRIYASHAPFGGNVVGIDAASWRYYGKSAHLLSWAESATLAVLPNAPSLMHPGKNRQALWEKRNRLLQRLLEQEKIDSITWALASEEALPDRPKPLPQLAPHLLVRAQQDQTEANSRIRTTIDPVLQQQVHAILKRNHNRLSANGIYNLAAIVVDIETGQFVAYQGNIFQQSANEHGHQVDIVRAPRSTGSIIKPFLYALALHEGKVLPQTLLPDIPTYLSGYRPQNFHESYDGLVPAGTAVSRSLNVPIVHLLQQYGLEKFHYGLQELGFETIDRSPDYYGLPLVLGGAEVTLEEVTNAYVCMARTLNHFRQLNGRYHPNDFRSLQYIQHLEKGTDKSLKEAPVLGAAAIWQTFEAMKKVERPDQEGRWENFQSGKAIAWKTGTSFGFRDAWTIGLDSRYAVGVWAGNADGEGRPGLVGVKAAAPVLFDIFNLLPSGGWFDPPYDEMAQARTCKESGFLASAICPNIDSSWIPVSGKESQPCPHHQWIHLNQAGDYQVHLDCSNGGEIVKTAWFDLGPIEAHYYKQRHPAYQEKPPYRPDCLSSVQGNEDRIRIIYPRKDSKIFIPKDIDGEASRTVFHAAHRDPEATIHWHIDKDYVGTTNHFHEMEFAPEPGIYHLILVDQDGNRSEQRFQVISK